MLLPTSTGSFPRKAGAAFDKRIAPRASPTHSQRTAALGSLKHGEELETFRGAFGIAYASASDCPGGVGVAACLVRGFGQPRARKAPARPGGGGARPDPPCPGRRWRPPAGMQGRRARGARPLPGSARHVGTAEGEGREALPRSRRPFSRSFPPPASRGAAPEPLPSGRGTLRSPLPPAEAGASGHLGQPLRLPRETPRAQRLMIPAPSRRSRRVRPTAKSHRPDPAPAPAPAPGRASAASPGPGLGTAGPAGGTARPGPPGYVPSGHSPRCPQGTGKNPLPFHPARCLTKHHIMKRVKINPTCSLPAPSLLSPQPPPPPLARSRFPHLA